MEIKSFTGAADYGNTRTDASLAYSNTAGIKNYYQESIPYSFTTFSKDPATSLTPKGTFDITTMFMDDYFFHLAPSTAGAVS